MLDKRLLEAPLSVEQLLTMEDPRESAVILATRLLLTPGTREYDGYLTGPVRDVLLMLPWTRPPSGSERAELIERLKEFGYFDRTPGKRYWFTEDGLALGDEPEPPPAPRPAFDSDADDRFDRAAAEAYEDHLRRMLALAGTRRQLVAAAGVVKRLLDHLDRSEVVGAFLLLLEDEARRQQDPKS